MSLCCLNLHNEKESTCISHFDKCLCSLLDFVLPTDFSPDYRANDLAIPCPKCRTTIEIIFLLLSKKKTGRNPDMFYYKIADPYMNQRESAFPCGVWRESSKIKHFSKYVIIRYYQYIKMKLF